MSVKAKKKRRQAEPDYIVLSVNRKIIRKVVKRLRRLRKLTWRLISVASVFFAAYSQVLAPWLS